MAKVSVRWGRNRRVRLQDGWRGFKYVLRTMTLKQGLARGQPLQFAFDEDMQVPPHLSFVFHMRRGCGCRHRLSFASCVRWGWASITTTTRPPIAFECASTTTTSRSHAAFDKGLPILSTVYQDNELN